MTLTTEIKKYTYILKGQNIPFSIRICCDGYQIPLQLNQVKCNTCNPYTADS